jgi:hypothetical protein
VSRYTLTERVRGKVSREGFDDLGAALDALERRGLRHQGAGSESAKRVIARLELNVKAGVDIRGDGSAVAFTGRLRRQEIEQQAGEDVYDALRRILSA